MKDPTKATLWVATLVPIGLIGFMMAVSPASWQNEAFVGFTAVLLAIVVALLAHFMHGVISVKFRGSRAAGGMLLFVIVFLGLMIIPKLNGTDIVEIIKSIAGLKK